MMITKNQETIKNETVKKLIDATEKLKESPIVEYFYNYIDKNPNLTGYRLMFNTKTEEFSIHFGFVDYEVTDKNQDDIMLHIFVGEDNQAKLINGPVKNFQEWMMSEIIPSYQNRLLEFVDGIDQPRELSCDGLCQVRADKKLASDFIQLGTQLELLQIYRKDVKFENLIYALLSFIYDYTGTRLQYEDEEFT